MPASGGDPVASALRADFASGSKLGELDNNVEASSKRVLLTSVDYEPISCYQSSVLTSLKSKSTVITSKVTNNKVTNGSNGYCKKQGTTLPTPKVTLFPSERVMLGFRNNVSVGSGMLNLGNTCYLNSTLQALFHVPAFVNWLISEPAHAKCEQNADVQVHPDDITCAVIKTYKCSQQKTGSTMKPICIFSKLKAICKHLSQGSQEDAHEFMRYLLESLEKNYLVKAQGHGLDSWSKETTPVNQIFGGYIRNEVTCLSCWAVSTTFQHFQDLPLDIRRASTLDDALAGYFERERLPDGEDAYKCEKCNRKVPATKKFSVEKPPNVLCVQLKRFSLLNGKLTKQVQLPQHLDLTRFVSSSVHPRHPVKYRLVSMVTHMGQSANCGHYTAIAQAANGYYYEFDDGNVRQTPLHTVLNMNTYLVLYELERPFPQFCTRSADLNSAADVQNKTNGASPCLVRPSNGTNNVNRTSNINCGPLRPNPPRPQTATSPVRSLIATTAGSTRCSTATPSVSKTAVPASTTASLVPYDLDIDSDAENKEGDSTPTGWKVTPVRPRPPASLTNCTSNWRITDIQSTSRKSGSETKASTPIHNNDNSSTVNSIRGSITTTSVASVSTDNWNRRNSDSKNGVDKQENNSETNGRTGRSPSTEKKTNGDRTIVHNSDSRRFNDRMGRSPNNDMRRPNDKMRRSPIDDVRNDRSNDNGSRNGDQRASDIVSELLSQTHRGYGTSNVRTWNGNVSNLDRQIQEERRDCRKRTSEDLYNADFDRGKVKKQKRLDRRRDDRNRGNLFQQRSNMANSWRQSPYDYGNHHQRSHGYSWNHRRNHNYNNNNNHNYPRY